jgi:hypothetical protein
MTMKLELTPEVQARLLSQAQENGLSLEAFAEQVLREKSRAGLLRGTSDSADAVRRLATFGKRHNLSLGGMTVKELLRESRP